MWQRWCFLISLFFFGSTAFAQVNIDEVLAEAAEKEVSETVEKKEQAQEEQEAKESDRLWRQMKPDELSNLATLAPFSDVAVIQRRFLPRTSRFEFFPNAGLVVNNAFFTNIVLGARLGFAFSESYGVEVSMMNIGNAEKTVTTDLREKHNIVTKSLVTPQMYYGIDFKWTPVYGKMALFNNGITPFDMFFQLGGGVTQTNQETSPPTLHLGVGQLFALTKSFAIRWNMDWYWYETDLMDTNEPGGSFLDMHFGVGISMFFPGAKYR